MKADEILKQALEILTQRGIDYNKKAGERSMEEVVAAFNILTHSNLTTEQGWLFMTILKVSRSQQGNVKLDNYIDGANYFALAGEQAIKDEKHDNNCIALVMGEDVKDEKYLNNLNDSNKWL